MTFDFDVHVCLISDQQAPNLLPALDPVIGPKDKKVVMLVSKEMKKNAGRLEGVLKRHGFDSQSFITRLDIEDPYDYEKIWYKLTEFLDRPEIREGKIALNLTGGTKIMALAAQSAFAAARRPMFYLDESTNNVIILEDGQTGHSEKQPLSVKLQLKDYLSVYGYETKPAAAPLSKTKFAKELIDNPQTYENALSRLNGEVNNAIKRSPSKCDFYFPATDEEVKVLEPLLKLCADHELIKPPVVTHGNCLLSFASESARKYVCGGWLEEYVFTILGTKGLKEKIQGKEMDLNILIGPKNTENNLDVVFMADNRLHIIECKTGRLEDDKAMPVLDKLRNLKSRTGLKTKALLASWRALDDKKNLPNKNRADEYGIKVIQKDDLRDLKTLLDRWIEAP
jgi:hypothetical protein